MVRQYTILSILWISCNCWDRAKGEVPSPLQKSFCAQSFGYKEIEEMKRDLLLNAKRLAVNELFGELITSTTLVENFTLTADQIKSSSIGFVRIDGDISYS